MKHFLFSIFVLFSMLVNAQKNYSVLNDENGNLILKGIITEQDLKKETSFQWFHQNQIDYEPSPAIVSSFKKINSHITFVIFGGTWCEDTQFILPRFFKLLTLSNTPESAITLLAVDRNKETIGNLSSVFSIKNVPTIIVLKDGIEVGRIIEYGKSGKWDEELTQLIK